MNRSRHGMRLSLSASLTATAILCSCVVCRADDATSGLEAALQQSRIKGGLCLVLGSCDVRIAEAVAAQSSWLVHCLTPDADRADSARVSLLKDGLHGLITAESWKEATLPFADHLVSMVLIFEPGKVSDSEILRVLRPDGETLTLRGGAWHSRRKPRPAEMDEWTHWRHGPDRNPVSKDRLVELPRRIQWLSAQTPEGKEMVSAAGLNFYAAGGTLSARDAFNGLPLWSRKIDAKCSHVAVGENVFAVAKGRLLCLDAATGAERRDYPAAATPEIILRVADPRDPKGVLITADSEAVCALAIGNGELLWKYSTPFPRALSVGDGRLYLVDGDPKIRPTCRLVALGLTSGRELWAATGLPWAKSCYRTCYGNGLVACELGRFAVPRTMQILFGKGEPDGIHFLSAKDGSVQLDYLYHPAMRHDENVRAFFVGDKVAVHRLEHDRKASSLVLFGDLHGEPEVFPALPPSGHYFYCYPPVATERFFIYGQMSFTDWATHEHTANQITRGSCGSWSEGFIPANGLIYAFPKSCNCFSMLHGFGALAPAYKEAVEEAHPLIRGPAYGAPPTANSKPDDWPCLRGGPYRNGSNPTTVPAELATLWTTPIAPTSAAGPIADEWKGYPFSSGSITAPVIAEGTLLVAQPHAHRVIALSAANGAPRWEFLADGRVDTPPTISEGRCLFGTRNGSIYCLRLADGTLCWRLRLAPAERRIVHFGQIESPWPAPGSLLVVGRLAYCGIGIHPLADGGIRVFAIHTDTGEVQWTKTVSDMGYDEKGWHARAGLEQDYFDLVTQDGDRVAMSRWVFDPETGRNEFLWHNAYYRLGANGAYMQRGTWSYGYPMNRPRMRRPLMVGRGESVLGANKVHANGAIALKMFRRDFQPGEKFDVAWDETPNDTDSRLGNYFPINRIAERTSWVAPYPGWIEAMVWAGDHLLVHANHKLKIYASADGNLLRELETARPVWDGMAASGGRLYLSTAEGQVVCFGAQ